MDSSGRMYMPPEYEAELVKMFKDKADALASQIKDVEFTHPPAGAMPIDDEVIARELAGMNRACRLVFFSERSRGASEAAALEAARESLPR